MLPALSVSRKYGTGAPSTASQAYSHGPSVRVVSTAPSYPAVISTFAMSSGSPDSVTVTGPLDIDVPTAGDRCAVGDVPSKRTVVVTISLLFPAASVAHT